ncbi:MAG: coenzyme-B sulfoethylthiotransferase subunit alpha [Candidatus Methanofastidiosia archaeon]
MTKHRKLFINAMEKKFKEKPEDKHTTFYSYGTWKQSKSKTQFVESSKRIAKERGIPGYNPDIGLAQGQRLLMPYQLNHTDYIIDMDDIHFINNAAMQQLWDDIRRTVIVGMDMAHNILEKRLGKEVTPETINHYMELINHTMPGGAVIQEHMVETNPELVSDCYVKIFTGDDELADELDKRFLIDINKEFPEDQAASLKKAIGKSTYQVVRVPTVVGRICDGGTISRWSGMQIGMTMMGAYNMAAGEAATADFSYAAKHASVINMSSFMPVRRARGANEPGGMPFGVLADCCQSMRLHPDDPGRHTLEVIAAGAVVYDQIYLGSYMSGGVGFTQYASATYTDNILEDFVYYGIDYIKDKYGDFATQKPSTKIIQDIGTDITIYCLEQYEQYPTVMESHFGGSQRAACIAAAAGTTTAMATGSAQAGINAWYLSMILHKEEMGRLGFYGYDLQDMCGSANSFAFRSDEGLPFEMRGPNYPNYAMNVGHMSAYSGIATAPHAARGDAWTLSPIIKIAFADKNLTFDFGNVTDCFGKGCMKEFMPAGERDAIIP